MNDAKLHLSAEQKSMLLDAVADVVCTVVHHELQDYRGDDIDRLYHEECARLCEELAAAMRAVRWQS
jgi:hypothetical protein